MLQRSETVTSIEAQGEKKKWFIDGALFHEKQRNRFTHFKMGFEVSTDWNGHNDPNVWVWLSFFYQGPIDFFFLHQGQI